MVATRRLPGTKDPRRNRVLQKKALPRRLKQKPYSDEVCWEVVALWLSGLSQKDIVSFLERCDEAISPAKVKRVVEFFATNGTIPNGKRGTPPLFGKEHKKLLRGILSIDSTLYIHEIQAIFRQTVQEDIPASTILYNLHHGLRDGPWTLKRVQIANANRRQDEIDTYCETVSNLFARQLLFLDETTKENRTAQRKFGWGP